MILKTLGVSKDEGIYLWGAGKFGIPLAHYLKERDVIINGIVDNKSYGKEIEGFNIPVIALLTMILHLRYQESLNSPYERGDAHIL